MLRLGSLSALCLGLPEFFRRQTVASERTGPRAKSCILLWLDGGPSHLETFDLKPDAPAEVRGPFQLIATNVPGIEICELLPHTARVCDKLAIVRSVTSPLGEHGLANRYLLTGYKPSPALEYPSFGSVTASLQSKQSVLPPYVAIPEVRYAGAGFLGGNHEPFVTGGDPSKPDFAFVTSIFSRNRRGPLRRRREYLAEFDGVQAALEAGPDPIDSGERAYRLVVADAARIRSAAGQPRRLLRERSAKVASARRLVERRFRLSPSSTGGTRMMDSSCGCATATPARKLAWG
jgi:hypothetical protein